MEFSPVANLLLYLVLPLWVLTGAADWLCHRRARIEATAGPTESLLHLALLGEAGIPLLAGLLLEINGVVLAVMVFFFFLHEATGYLDIRYAQAHRGISPIEQRVHDYLTAIPFAALLLVMAAHWPATLSLVGQAPFDAALRWKDAPLPVGYVLGILGAVLLFNGLPYLEELWRGLRVKGRRTAPAPLYGGR